MPNLLRRNKLAGEKGFTLIELILIIVLIGILAAIGLQQYVQVRERAANTVHEANTRLLRGAGQMGIFVWDFPEEEIRWTREDKDTTSNAWEKGWGELLIDWPDVPRDSGVYTSEAEYVILIGEDGYVDVKVE